MIRAAVVAAAARPLSGAPGPGRAAAQADR
jgi:hypothetical protein